MKNLRHINDFLHLNEDVKTPEFINQDKLKNLLLKDEEFAQGDVHQAIIDLAHDEWQKHNNWDYGDVCNWLHKNFGNLALVAMYFGKYNYQVCNGGHLQYFSNGYASEKTSGNGSDYEDIENHDKFVELFNQLDLNNLLPSGDDIYNIISNFELDLSDEIENCYNCSGNGEIDCYACDGTGNMDCDACNGEGEDDDGNECDNCNGDGNIQCSDCDGRGSDKCEECDGTGEVETGNKIPETSDWEKLDSRWYEINDKAMKEFNNYLKSLTLDGENISDLIELAKNTQAYNL